jgi:hypothetical protein
MPALRGGTFCWQHARDHDVERRRREAARSGGRVRGLQIRRAHGAAAASTLEPPPPWWHLESVDDAARGFAWTAQRVAMGELDSKSAAAIVGALNGLVGALRDGAVENRLDMLETVLGPRKVG